MLSVHVAAGAKRGATSKAITASHTETQPTLRNLMGQA
jgi:hypothetical protein